MLYRSHRKSLVLKLVADPAKNIVVIMKDGKIYKNLIR